MEGGEPRRVACVLEVRLTSRCTAKRGRGAAMHRRPTMKILLVAVFVVSASLAGILVNFAGRTTLSPSILSAVATTAFDFNATLGLNLTLTVKPASAAQGR